MSYSPTYRVNQSFISKLVHWRLRYAVSPRTISQYQSYLTRSVRTKNKWWRSRWNYHMQSVLLLLVFFSLLFPLLNPRDNMIKQNNGLHYHTSINGNKAHYLPCSSNFSILKATISISLTNSSRQSGFKLWRTASFGADQQWSTPVQTHYTILRTMRMFRWIE
jgi:hypothetical protein